MYLRDLCSRIIIVNKKNNLIIPGACENLTYFDPTFHRRDSYISGLMSGLLRVDGSGLDAVTHLALLGVESVRNGVLGVLKV